MSDTTTAPTIDVVCAGESMAMFVPTKQGAPSASSLYQISVAGAESNVATYLRMLGLNSSWVSRVGSDAFGRFILGHLADEGVDVTHAEIDDTKPTGAAFKNRTADDTHVDYYRSSSAFSGIGPSTAAKATALNPAIIHISGITLALSESCRDFIAHILANRSADSLVSFDVNWRPALWEHTEVESPADRILATAQASDIVLVGLDEAEALWGHTNVAEVRALISAPTILVVKQGASGCTVFNDGQVIPVPALFVNVVEPVGAGDAFAAGFLAGYLERRSIRDSARLGTIVASSALSVSTDVGPLPPPEFIATLLNLEDSDWNGQRYPSGNDTRSTPHVANG
ncbi:sugar kinase [Lysinibacter cavernae]|uniref:2-dehydro-3-deoxygluconokinase n=1 Tax=Lysinibacter cavernae TaxID=1640652 RepID=A0A7X5TUQ6_9MICO|nr:sugar kinase [Lysinibacter cavernae]NIH54804.1 2-dehydro-3-deoxygluconokinase [Lysinibacter cavernae]